MKYNLKFSAEINLFPCYIALCQDILSATEMKLERMHEEYIHWKLRKRLRKEDQKSILNTKTAYT